MTVALFIPTILCRYKCRFTVGIDQGADTVMITVNIRYTGSNGSARSFADEMIHSGTVAAIRTEEGNLRYEYYASLEDPETILLIDSWRDQEAIDTHHASPMMKTIAALREKYDLHMRVERFRSEDVGTDDRFIRK
jgi:quinol monooxygenase YgiN